jgi:L-fucose isomerase-like protein
MIQRNKVVIGIAPTKRGFLSLDEAARQKNMIYEQIKKISPECIDIVDIEDICPKGVLWELEKVDKVVGKFKMSGIDGLFIPHCDFGTEEVVGKLGKAMNVPLLLWGPRDESPDETGYRARDTQCGIFASSKVLQRYKVPFSYIVNSYIDGIKFSEGFLKFARIVSVVKAMKNLRIAQISTRPKPFMSVICNEGELLSKFGIEIVPLSVPQITSAVLDMVKVNTEELKQELEDIKSRIDVSSMRDEDMAKIAAFKLSVAKTVKANGCSAIAMECWSLLPSVLGIVPCFAIAELTDIGIPAACETDINGVITSVMLQAASLGESSSFFADLTIRHPSNENAELLWHCGPFPYSLKSNESKAAISAGRGQWELKKGDITIARFDELDGKYSLFAGEAKAVDGPMTTGTYVWVEVDNWKKWEEKFIFGPYIHHVAGAYGKYRQVLVEACKFIPGLKADTVEGCSPSL